MIEKFNPKAIVFIEKHGPNEKGYFHTVTGNRIDEQKIANTQYLLPLAKERGILTIGAGDGGNEIGNGKIYEEIKHIPECLYGVKCRCGCGGRHRDRFPKRMYFSLRRSPTGAFTAWWR